ncbi:MAG: hypothetical protein WCW62_08485 [Bacteroidales bacterium]
MRYAKNNITKTLILMSVCISLVLLISCKKENPEYPAPTIRFVTGNGLVMQDTTLLLNETLRIGLSAHTNSNQPLTHFHTTLIKDSILTNIDTALYATSFNYDKEITKGIALTETRIFYVRDRDGRKSNEISLTIRLDSLSVYGSIQYLPEVKMGAQNNDSSGSFCSLPGGKVSTTAEAFADQASVNLLYYYDLIEADKNTLASPGANLDASVFPGSSGLINWTVKNTTRFAYQGNITPAQFDLCRNDSLIQATSFEFETGKRKAKTLSNGQVYAFVTDTGIKGLFKITEVLGDENGTIKIFIKMKN